VNSLQAKNDAAVDLENVSIIGEKICLVSLNSSFAQDIFSEFSEEIASYMIPKPAQEIRETHDFIEASIQGMKNQEELVLAIVSTKREFLGCCGLHGRGKGTTPELGIWLKKSAHGYRFGQSAINLLVTWASENLIIDYFIYPVDRENVPSRKIPESLGGTIFKEAKVKTHSNNVLDEVIYKIDV